MGGNTSIFQNSEQDTNTRVAQISNENCVNACIDNGNALDIIITNSTINGDINFTSACLISGASCTLKASLDSTLINTQSNKQSGDIDDENNIFTALNQLFDIGSTDDITQSNYQSISNEVSQVMNSTCQNEQEITNNSLAVRLTGDTINGDINLTEKGTIANTQCIITNQAKSYVKNDQKNTQVATITKGGCLGGLGGLAGLLLIFVILKLFHSNHGQQQVAVKKQCTTADNTEGNKCKETGESTDKDKKSSTPSKDKKSPTDKGKKSSTPGKPKTKESLFGKFKNEF